MQDLNDKITGNTLTAAEWNEVPSELQNVIEALGITLSGADLNQLGKAIAGYVANGNYYTDGGAADAYVLSTIGSKQSPTAYTDGMSVLFRPVANNTGACTVNVAGLGVKSVKTSAGADPAAGRLVNGELTTLRYDLGNDWFELTQPLYDGSSASFLSLTTVKSNAANTTPVFEDNASREMGQLCKAWVNFNGTGVVAIRDSFNVSSITDYGVGDYGISFTNNMPNANYAPAAMLSANGFPSPTTVIATVSVSELRVYSQGVSAGAAVFGDTADYTVSVHAND